MQANTPVPALSLRGLSKTYRLPWKRARLRALDGLDLDVRAGEVFGLLGPNGSGKSTTLKLLLGLARPDAGTAQVFGHAAGTVAARRKIGFMPEEPRFYKFLTGAELLRFHGTLAGLSGAALTKRIEEMLDLVGLSSSEAGTDRPLSSYSKGMLQRIGLAQALLHDPDLVILDEPTAGVDPLGAREIRALIGRLKAAGKTVLFSTHLLTEAEALADHVAILHRGRKILEGTPDTLLALPGGTEISVRGAAPLSDADREAVAALLREKGATETTFRPARRTLEEVFVQAVEPKQK